MNGESSRKRLKKYFWFCKFTRRCEERRSAWVKDERWFVWWDRWIRWDVYSPCWLLVTYGPGLKVMSPLGKRQK
jgi:hypothetical protein